jgi:hypothetical protein
LLRRRISSKRISSKRVSSKRRRIPNNTLTKEVTAVSNTTTQHDPRALGASMKEAMKEIPGRDSTRPTTTTYRHLVI